MRDTRPNVWILLGLERLVKLLDEIHRYLKASLAERAIQIFRR